MKTYKKRFLFISTVLVSVLIIVTGCFMDDSKDNSMGKLLPIDLLQKGVNLSSDYNIDRVHTSLGGLMPYEYIALIS